MAASSAFPERQAVALASATDLMSLARKNRSSLPTLAGSHNVSQVSLSTYFDGENEPPAHCKLDVGLSLDSSEPSTPLPVRPIPRVRSATLCTDTARNLSTVSLSGVAPVHREMSRDRSMVSLADQASGNDAADHDPWESNSDGGVTPVMHVTAQAAAFVNPLWGETAWMAPHPVHLPPTIEDVDDDHSHGHSVAHATAHRDAHEDVVIDMTAVAPQRNRSISAIVQPLRLPESSAGSATILNPLARWSHGPAGHAGHAHATAAGTGIRRNHSSQTALSKLAVELDLPVNGARYEECVICRIPGICDDDRCCKVPRHHACELANQRANPQKWQWDGQALSLPCSACRQTWMTLMPGDPLAVEVLTKLVEDRTVVLAERRRALQAEILAAPDRHRTKRRVMIVVPTALLAFVVCLLALKMGLAGVALTTCIGVAVAAAVVMPPLAVLLIEYMRLSMRLAVAEEMAGLQTTMPGWVRPVLAEAKRHTAIMQMPILARQVPPSPVMAPVPL